MYCKMLATAAVLAGLAGCTVGMTPGSGGLSGSFEAGRSYQEAYEAAAVQAERCLLGQGGYRVDRSIDTGARTAQVRVVAPFFNGETARVDIAALDAGRSRVQVDMWGKSIWNRAAMQAMREAVVYGVPSCSDYMPRAEGEQEDWIKGE